jgi:hypothetical protein
MGYSDKNKNFLLPPLVAKRLERRAFVSDDQENMA